MDLGCVEAVSQQDVTNSECRICEKCQKLRPITNFAGKGSHTSKDGTKTKYRSKMCRRCEKAQKIASGICKMCCSPAESGKHHCQKHLNLLKDSNKRLREKDKLAAFEYYGSLCQFCGESIELFLTIDHKNNDGAEHRRKLRSGNNRGHDIYAWLRKNQYPEGFQTLCFNCNAAKHIYGEKPLLEELTKHSRCVVQ